MESINKKNKNANVKDFMVKNHLWVFVNCQIENPAFDSQVCFSPQRCCCFRSVLVCCVLPLFGHDFSRNDTI